jgi:hypothetical protein
MIRLQNDAYGRAMHEPLHQRLTRFCQQYTPEVPSEPIVSTWLNRLYNNDPSLHILIETDQHNPFIIIEHAVIEVQEGFGLKGVICHQVERNKANLESFDVGIEYIDKLVQQTGAVCSIIYVTKHSKALERKYGYKISRIAMVKHNAANQEDEE